MQALELWGGVECTVNRVGDEYLNQLERSGHARRAEDLERLAALGVRRVRYPVLWELTAPDGADRADWRWADERLSRLRRLGVDPIVGLVHHGSGPAHTSLLDEHFATGLADYAEAVARRYPWVEWYTPVNEPLTTARFAALYGHWYPHHRDGESFIRALVNQCRAVALAMRAIRRVNPQARLVQTDDLGRVHSTAALSYQADFENERRWLTWDLLGGRVDAGHPMWEHLRVVGGVEDDLRWLADHPCPPDIVGINHYLTSERVLDHRLAWYPEHAHGGNGRDRYADVEAVRVRHVRCAGFEGVLREAATRYGVPVAVTEAHLGCTREEQVRWLDGAWRAAVRLREAGHEVRAVTVWALFGSCDWNSLCTRRTAHYEPGAFDVRGPEPRPTALARWMVEVSRQGAADHPVLGQPGWWERSDRFVYPPLDDAPAGGEPSARAPEAPAVASTSGRGHPHAPRPLLITGATGTLGRAFARICEERGLAYRLCSREEMDICGARSVAAMLDAVRPWGVVNTAGYVRVDDAEREPERCFRENRDGAASVAAECSRLGLPLVTFSSDLVFDGSTVEPYGESDPVAPLNVYGASKAEAERWVLDRHRDALVVRTSAFFGVWDEHNFVTIALRALERGEQVVAMHDVVVSPTYVPDLVHTCLDLLIDGASGLWHLANQGALSWASLATQAASLAGLDATGIEARGWRDMGLVARRPAYSALASERGMLLPTLDDALDRYMAAMRAS